jgi:hypothetical protein
MMAETIKPAMVLTIGTMKERYYREDQIRQAVEEAREQYEFPIDYSWAEAAAHESGFHIALDKLSARLGLEEET